MKDNWKKIGKKVSPDETTIVYYNHETQYVIESRKRHIPHANREGTWDHTSYFVRKEGQDLKEKHSLRDAKEYAERLANGEDKSNH